jgi:hypothetical protein
MAKIKDIPWSKLDPSKADYEAIEGAYINGVTLLALPRIDLFVVTGICSCSTKENAEAAAQRYGHKDADYRISRKTLKSWLAAD